ncbi:FkbM family methyltransferase [Variovorax sp. efr-133-TYG-130]|uniref:FkbM family methyltransferase n=1 Tax=Variovorax sp. efr-133-TYG-130 TaxID=3040327 RepID=UPI0025535C52|nr:FkbM family methyltransferase [Variovorax sp. efr-133-TYG-130]
MPKNPRFHLVKCETAADMSACFPETATACTDCFRISLCNSMTFISYAQNFEDVMLWRALKHVPAGMYIDVGAQDPVVDSVSKAFYEQGWRGIHVEPVPRYADMLRRDRPDETVLQLALSDQAGILELAVFDDTGLSTGIKEFAESHRTQHGLAHRIVPTPMLTMRTAFASLAGRPVHWLKIDVEGLEEAVLRGWDSEALRPWIIVIEATVPMSTEVRYQGAEDILLAARYEFVYFDGLNRFYLAAEHLELRAAFSSPPNVFDGVRLSGLANSELCRGVLDTHRAETKALDDTIRALRAEVVEMQAKAQRRQREIEAQAERDSMTASTALQLVELQRSETQHRLDAVLHSSSWQVTAPLRSASTQCRRVLSAFRDGRLISGVKRRIKAVLRVCALGVARHPKLKRGLLTALKLVPPLNRRLRAMLAPPSVTPQVNTAPNEAASAMSPATRAVYRALMAANGRK